MVDDTPNPAPIPPHVRAMLDEEDAKALDTIRSACTPPAAEVERFQQKARALDCFYNLSALTRADLPNHLNSDHIVVTLALHGFCAIVRVSTVRGAQDAPVKLGELDQRDLPWLIKDELIQAEHNLFYNATSFEAFGVGWFSEGGHSKFGINVRVSLFPMGKDPVKDRSAAGKDIGPGPVKPGGDKRKGWTMLAVQPLAIPGASVKLGGVAPEGGN